MFEIPEADTKQRRPAHVSVFLGRQPILDRMRRTYGHLTSVVGDGLAFINVTADFLRSELYRLLPAERVILELLEYVDFGPETVSAMRSAVGAGFRMALDDLVSADGSGTLVDTPRGQIDGGEPVPVRTTRGPARQCLKGDLWSTRTRCRKCSASSRAR